MKKKKEQKEDSNCRRKTSVWPIRASCEISIDGGVLSTLVYRLTLKETSALVQRSARFRNCPLPPHPFCVVKVPEMWTISREKGGSGQCFRFLLKKTMDVVLWGGDAAYSAIFCDTKWLVTLQDDVMT
ncbi:hypothetical protein TNCV_3105601 [Trichonephila clavipes]|nr:hypothetical protein TNCV_3105601 [Trichonephila clavipes]